MPSDKATTRHTLPVSTGGRDWFSSLCGLERRPLRRLLGPFQLLRTTCCCCFGVVDPASPLLCRGQGDDREDEDEDEANDALFVGKDCVCFCNSEDEPLLLLLPFRVLSSSVVSHRRFRNRKD